MFQIGFKLASWESNMAPDKLGAFMDNTWWTVVILGKWNTNWKMEMQNRGLLSSLSPLLGTSEFIITHEHLQRLPLQASGELLVKLELKAYP